MNATPAVLFAVILLTGMRIEAEDVQVFVGPNEETVARSFPVANGDGEVLFLGQVGPMSVRGHAPVKWGLYRDDGSFTGRRGTVGVSGSGTKATAFAGADGNFYVLTTAK